eukprot:6237014-Lingulodinium_polyedra.AAC.1
MERAKRAICEPPGRRTAIATASLCNVCKTLHKDAVAIAARRRNGLQIARLAHYMRTRSWRSHGACETCDLQAAAAVLLGCCLGAAW